MAESVRHVMRQIEISQSRHCVSRLAEQTRDLLLDQGKAARRPHKRSHQCSSEHKRWLRDFYRSYSHQELLQHLQAGDEARNDALDLDIGSTNHLVAALQPVGSLMRDIWCL